jgi:acyl-CoA thioester hydrolase
VAGVPVYRTAIAREWIDYNGHLRDAYYALIVSQATDALMDRLGMDAGYRAATACTLYTLEMHLHFLKEVKLDQTVEVRVRLLGADRKRLHAAFELVCAGAAEPCAGAELMLLHVHQGATVRARAFPPEVAAPIGELLESSGTLPAEVPASRVISLQGTARSASS